MNKKNFFMYVGVFLLGGITSVFLYAQITAVAENKYVANDVRDRLTSTQFTNPLLECAELPEQLSIRDRLGLQSKIEALIADKKKSGALVNASVYYRDLNNGPWFGVNEDEKFSPASLLKVPLAMWYYWKADEDPQILQDQIKYISSAGHSEVHFAPRKKLEVGNTYAVDEIIHIMLKESDNEAAAVLAKFSGKDGATRVYEDFGIPPLIDETSYFIDVRTYSSFFRILYNATYLGRFYSEHVLGLMHESSFTQGLVAGVPDTVRVSHKFGEKVIDESVPLRQLHDCGIVYAEPSPYMLCVMTQGKDFDELANIISLISSTIYTEVRK